MMAAPGSPHKPTPKLVPACLLLLCSAYFFHGSWMTQLPFVDHVYLEIERLFFVNGWIRGVFPSDSESSLFSLFNFYLSHLGPAFHAALGRMGYSFDLDMSNLLLARLLSALFALGSVSLIWRAAGGLFGPAAGWFSALFLILSPAFASYSQTGMHHFHTVFFALLAYYCLAEFLREQRVPALAPRGLAAGASYGLFFTSNHYSVFFSVPVLAAVFLKSRRARDGKPALAALAGFLLVVGIIGPHFFRHPSWYLEGLFTGFFYHISGKESGPLLSVWQSLAHMLPHTFGWPALVCFCAGAVRLARLSFKSGAETERFHLGTTLFYMTPLLFGGIHTLPVRWLLAAPLFAITAGYGLSWLLSAGRFGSLGVRAALAAAIFGWQAIVCWAWLDAKLAGSQMRRAVEWLKQEQAATSPSDRGRALSLLVSGDENPGDYSAYLYPSPRPVKWLKWTTLDQQITPLDRFLRMPFDYALYTDLNLTGADVDVRSSMFRENLMEELRSGRRNLSLVRVFEPRVSLLGFRFEAPYDNQALSVISFSRVYLIRNGNVHQPLKEVLKGVPAGQRAALVHTHSSDFSSNGNMTLEEMAREVQRMGLSVWIPTDSLLREWRYRLGPFERSVEQPSVMSRGLERYLDALKRLRKTHPRLTVIPGVEVTPHYYWTGYPFFNMTLHDGSKHLLVIGLENAKDYDRLPIRKPYDVRRNLGDVPAQEWIDAARKEQGAVFWAHPDSIDTAYPVQIRMAFFQTLPYAASLSDTYGYDGFAALNEGVKLTSPGGLWDRLLLEHCRGKRDPVYAIGESDYGRISKSSPWEDPYVFTVFLSPRKDEAGLLRLLKGGGTYSLRTSNDGRLMWLESFSVKPLSPDRAEVRVSVRTGGRKARLVVVGNGEKVVERSYDGDFRLSQAVVLKAAGERSYVRLTVSDSNGGLLVSNPIIWRNRSSQR